MAGGRCTATVKTNGRSTVAYVPRKYWGLEGGKTYRLIVSPAGAPSNFIPFSTNVKIHPQGKASCLVVIPSSFGFKVGDEINIWVGDMEDYFEESLPHERGRNQKERQKDLERAEYLFH